MLCIFLDKYHEKLTFSVFTQNTFIACDFNKYIIVFIDSKDGFGPIE